MRRTIVSIDFRPASRWGNWTKSCSGAERPASNTSQNLERVGTFHRKLVVNSNKNLVGVGCIRGRCIDEQYRFNFKTNFKFFARLTTNLNSCCFRRLTGTHVFSLISLILGSHNWRRPAEIANGDSKEIDDVSRTD